LVGELSSYAFFPNSANRSVRQKWLRLWRLRKAAKTAQSANEPASKPASKKPSLKLKIATGKNGVSLSGGHANGSVMTAWTVDLLPSKSSRLCSTLGCSSEKAPGKSTCPACRARQII
jgi:hypothetical protein